MKLIKAIVVHCLLLLTVTANAEDGLRLINGKDADPKEFPASVWANLGGGLCTATVVGERTAFIAAHCVRGITGFTFSVGPNKYKTTCQTSKDYKNNSTADYSLCVIDKPVTGIVYEKINIDETLVKVNDEVLLSGYGCIKSPGNGGNDGTYRIGEAFVKSIPSGTNNDIITNRGAALCYGDSGGPAFKVNKATGDRFVIATNSRGDIKTTSYLSATHTSQAKKFITEWSKSTGQKICGVHSDAVGCRGAVAPSPTPAPVQDTFQINHKVVSLSGKMGPGFEKYTADLVKILEDVLNKVEF